MWCALALLGPAAAAQLISPGPLLADHASLDGISNCTQCHQLGRRGIEPAKCLSCHTPLRDRIRRGEGFHADLDPDCATCHSDHHGRTFDPIRLDEDAFDHREAGFALVGQHLTVDCQSCHKPAFITDRAVRKKKGDAGKLKETFLGLTDTCEGCHAAESPHAGASFENESCATCHAPTGWERVDGFDHARTGFALVGAHVEIKCQSCHAGSGADRFSLASDCASCHRDESPHGRQFGGQDCATCHTASRWDGAARFDHARTDFPLVGQHRQASCGGCHPGQGAALQFAGIDDECATCHDDAHDGTLGADCQSCHQPTAWTSLGDDFDAARFDHQQQTGFALVGAHLALDCAGCHAGRDDAIIQTRRLDDGDPNQTFAALAHEQCADCHRDAHQGQLDGALADADCAACHDQDAFAPARFDLARHQTETAFALVGAHLAVPCASCHTSIPGGAHGTVPDFEVDQACAGCHAADSPHGDQFADASGQTDCASCHGPEAWAATGFDHGARTGFALVGAHATASCASCHADAFDGDRLTGPIAAASAECASCHAEDNPHGTQFASTSCDRCHDTAAFTLAGFDHSGTAFPLDGAHEAVPCGSCHRPEPQPTGPPIVRFRPLGTACADCHSG